MFPGLPKDFAITDFPPEPKLPLMSKTTLSNARLSLLDSLFATMVLPALSLSAAMTPLGFVPPGDLAPWSLRLLQAGSLQQPANSVKHVLYLAGAEGLLMEEQQSLSHCAKSSLQVWLASAYLEDFFGGVMACWHSLWPSRCGLPPQGPSSAPESLVGGAPARRQDGGG